MGVAMKWLGAAVLALGWLAGSGGAMAQAPAAAPQGDPAVWGMYARLPGTVWNGEGGDITWAWGPDGNSIVETRTGMRKSVIRPGARPGELVWEYGSLDTYDARVGADGAILWLRRGRPAKKAARVHLDGGRFVEDIVKLDAAQQVVEVSSTWPYRQISGPKLDAMPGAAPQAAVAAAVEPPGAAPVATVAVATTDGATAPASSEPGEWTKRWGVLAHMVGRRWFSGAAESLTSDAAWRVPGEVLVTTTRDASGKVLATQTTTWNPATGELVTTLASLTNIGVAQDDGSLRQNTVGGPYPVRSTTRLLGDGSVESVVETLRDGRWGESMRVVLYERTPQGIALWQQAQQQLQEKGEAERLALARQAELDRAVAQAEAIARAARGSSAATQDTTPSPPVAERRDASGTLVMGADGEWEAADGDWDDDEDAALAAMEDEGRGPPPASSEPPLKGLYDALVQANAEADAHLQQTQASYDATMAQARRQAALERAQAAAERDADDAAERQREVELARQATQQQYEIARQREAQRQAAELARRQREAAISSSRDAMTPTLPAASTTKMCSHPGSQQTVFDQKASMDERVAKACGRLSTPTLTKQECDSSGWCKAWIQCSAWEASCPAGASAQ